jgi:hypothetical protein
VERAKRCDFPSEAIVLHFKGEGPAERLTSITLLEEDDGAISRIRDYCFCPETLAAVAADLDLAFARPPYHQGLRRSPV